MTNLFPEMFDRPDSSMVGGGLAFTAAMYVVLPFFILLFAVDLLATEALTAWGELVYHVLAFALFVWLYRSYLADCLRPVREKGRQFWMVTGVCLFAALCVMILYFFLYEMIGTNYTMFARFYAIPMAENNFITYPMELIRDLPVLGVICMTVLAPVTLCCLYYGTGFAPVCYDRPWLAYLTVTVLLAVPRLINCMTYRWIVEMEICVFLAQLPLHYIACYAYQRTDSIWSPVVIHTALNLFGCITVLLYFR